MGFEINNGILIKYSMVFNSSSGTYESEVIIPDGVTTIGDSAFEDCERLTSITMPDSVTSIGNFAFYTCRSLKNIKIPAGVTAIGDSAFEFCKSLKSITIPDNVSTIGISAFAWCERLTGITIPDSITTIGDYAFIGCRGLADRDGFVIVKDILFDYYGPGGDVTIPGTVTNIGNSAFSWCKSLTGITIPDCVTAIGRSAFEGCERLTGISIPDNVTTIGMDAFSDCPLRYVVCYTPYVVSYFGEHRSRTLVYLGGPVSDLDERYWRNAAKGFMYAMEQGMTQISQWRDGYLEYIKDHVSEFMEDAQSERSVLLFLIKEELLNHEDVRRLLDHFDKKIDTEAKAALLQYIHDTFGTDDVSDLDF